MEVVDAALPLQIEAEAILLSAKVPVQFGMKVKVFAVVVFMESKILVSEEVAMWTAGPVRAEIEDNPVEPDAAMVMEPLVVVVMVTLEPATKVAGAQAAVPS